VKINTLIIINIEKKRTPKNGYDYIIIHDSNAIENQNVEIELWKNINITDHPLLIKHI